MSIYAAAPEGPETFNTTAGLLRLRTLVRLRWLAVFGQSLAVLGVHFILNFPLPLVACLGVIALSAWLNIFLTLRWRSSLRLAPTQAGFLLGYDVIQLALLLYPHRRTGKSFCVSVSCAGNSFCNFTAIQMDTVAQYDCFSVREFSGDLSPAPSVEPHSAADFAKSLCRRNVGGHHVWRGIFINLCAAHC